MARGYVAFDPFEDPPEGLNFAITFSSRSMGNGKTIVWLFSVAISVIVCK